jgi:hypothetical protein
MLRVSWNSGSQRDSQHREIKTFLEGKEGWLEEGILVPTKKNKRGRVIREGSSTAQEGGAQQNYVPPFGGILAPSSYYGDVPMQALGNGAAMPPPNFAVPNVAFAEPYAHLPQPQQSVAIIRGYAARNMRKYRSHPNQCKPNG